MEDAALNTAELKKQVALGKIKLAKETDKKQTFKRLRSVQQRRDSTRDGQESVAAGFWSQQQPQSSGGSAEQSSVSQPTRPGFAFL